jgi:hypothetical protein
MLVHLEITGEDIFYAFLDSLCHKGQLQPRK